MAVFIGAASQMASSPHKFMMHESPLFMANTPVQQSESLAQPEHERNLAKPVSHSYPVPPTSLSVNQKLKSKSRFRMVKHNLPLSRVASSVVLATPPSEPDVLSHKYTTHKQRSTVDQTLVKLHQPSMCNTAPTSQNLLHIVPRGHNMDDTTSFTEATRGQVDHVDRKLLKQINHYVRAHPFITQSLNGHTTTQRRTFERDIYDYARTIGLLKEQARVEVRRARAFCGELDYNSDDSRLGDEIDDSAIILNAATSETASASKDGFAEILPIKHVSIKVSESKAGMITGRRGRKIDKMRWLSGSTIEVQYPEDDSKYRQINITGTHEQNQIALDMISTMRRAETREGLKDCRAITVPMASSEALGDQDIATEAVDTLSAPLQIPEPAERSKKRKAEHAKPVLSSSTSAALEGDRHQKRAKLSRTEVVAFNRVSEDLPDGQEEPPPTAKASQLKDSHTKKSCKNNPEHPRGDLTQFSPNDDATDTQKGQAKKEREKRQKAKKAEAQELDKTPNVKRARHMEATDPVSSIASISSISNHEDGAVVDPAAITPSDKAGDTTIQSDGKAFIKHKKDRKTKKDCSKEQDPSKDTLTNETPAVELSEMHVGTSKSKKGKKKTRLHKESETSVKTAVEESKEKSTKSKKRKEPPLIYQEKQEANGEPEVEKNASSKSAGKSARHRQADMAPVVVATEEEEFEEEIRSEYFTPTKPKSKEYCPDSNHDSGVKKQENSPSKAKSSLRMGMEEKRRSFYAELRRRSSLGPTIAASLEDKVDTNVPVVELDISAHVTKAEDEDPSKEETKKTKNITQVGKPKKKKLKKRQSVDVKDDINIDKTARTESPAILLQSTQVVKPDQEIPAVDTKTNSLAKASKRNRNREKEKEEYSTTADTTGTALISESNENHSSALTMSNTATSIYPDLDIPKSPLQYSGWNPVNQANLNAKILAESPGSNPPYIAVKSEINGAHSYVNDPMELDQESCAVISDHEACRHPGPGKASRKRKKTTNVVKQTRDSSGTMTPTKKPRLMKEEARSSADFSSPMIR
ncbi:hypothetical protein MMC17_007021 [Xylographa soralifera]|nr:hypothetical protein [Xylographa soralifera]